MEFMAFRQCMDFLILYGLIITTFISDRHVSIASHMKKVLHKIKHYFDIWHLKKSETNYIYFLSYECTVDGVDSNEMLLFLANSVARFDRS